MSSTTASSGTSGSTVILQGQINYTAWLRNFKVAAEAKDLWRLLTGDEKVGEKPQRPTKPKPDATVTANLRSSDTTIAANASNLIKSLQEDYRVNVSEYNLDLKEYEDRAERARDARALLLQRIDDSLQGQITDTTDPKAAFDQIKAICKISDDRAIELKYAELDAITSATFSSVSELINRLTSIKQDLAVLSEEYTDKQVMSKVLKCLPKHYEDFKRHWNMVAGSSPAFPRNVQTLQQHLLAEEASIRMAKEEEKTSRSKDNSGGTTKKKSEDSNKGKKTERTVGEEAFYKPAKETRTFQKCSSCNRVALHRPSECKGDAFMNGKKKDNVKKEVNQVVAEEHSDKEDENIETKSSKRPKKVVCMVQVDLKDFEAQIKNSFNKEWELDEVIPPYDPSALTDQALIDAQLAAEMISLPATDDDDSQEAKASPAKKGADEADTFQLATKTSKKTKASMVKSGITTSNRFDLLADIGDENIVDTPTSKPLGTPLFQYLADSSQELQLGPWPRNVESCDRISESVGVLGQGFSGGGSNIGVTCSYYTVDSERSIPHTHVGLRFPAETMMLLKDGAVNNNRWLLDSGANICITNNKNWFKNFTPLSYQVGTASDPAALRIKGHGTVTLPLQIEGDTVELEVNNVAFAPDARSNILSMSWIAQKAKLSGAWNDEGIGIRTKAGVTIGKATLVDGMYVLELDSPTEQTNESHHVIAVTQHDDPDSESDTEFVQPQPTAKGSQQAIFMPPGAKPPFVVAEIDYNQPVMRWHRRLGHIGMGNLLKLLKHSEGIDLTEKEVKAALHIICPICATTKAVNRVPKDPATRRATVAGDTIHLDSWGPYPVRGHDTSQYVLALTDDATRFTWSTRYTTKDQLPERLRKLSKLIQRKHNITIRKFRMDNELYRTNVIKNWLDKHGIACEPSVPYTHHMNGVAERQFRTEREKSSAMMHEVNLPKRISKILAVRCEEMLQETTLPEVLWIEAFEQAIWLKNRSPSRALSRSMTPWQALYDLKPDLSVERIFGSRVYVTLPPEKRLKSLLQARGTLTYFVGMETEAVMKVWEPESKKVIRTTASKVDDGVGLEDPQDEESIRDRAPRPYIPDEEQEGADFEDESDDESVMNDEVNPDDENGLFVPERANSPDESSDMNERSRFFNHMADINMVEKQAKHQKLPRYFTTEQAIFLDAYPDLSAKTLNDIFAEMFPDAKKFPSKTLKVYRHVLQHMSSDDVLEMWPRFHNDQTRLQIIQNTEATNAYQNGPTEKRSIDAWTARERMAIDILQKRDLNVKSIHAILTDICPSTPRTSVSVKHETKQVRSGAVTLDETLRTQLESEIDQSKALEGFLPKHTKATAYFPEDWNTRCNSCKKGRRKCKGKPCKRCISTGRPCTFDIDDNVSIAYYPDGVEPKHGPMYEGWCVRCSTQIRTINPKLKEASCDGDFPCNNCKAVSKRTKPNVWCRQRAADGGYISYNFHIGTQGKDDAPETTEEHQPPLETTVPWTEEDEAMLQESLQRSKNAIHAFNLSTQDATDYADDTDDSDESDEHDSDFHLDPALRHTDQGGNAEVNMVSSGQPYHPPHCFLTETVTTLGPEPHTRKQALRSSESKQWQAAMDEEYSSLIQSETWKVVKRPDDRKVLSTRWVFKRKIGADGQVKRHKARFVVRGFTQVYGLDFDETFASVVKGASYRLLFALQAKFGWICHQMDIKTAFLNGDLEHEIYIQPPDGYPETEGKVLLLTKSLYGLKQSPRQWNKTLNDFLVGQGWRVCEYDASIYIHDKLQLIMDVYVDDIKILGANVDDILLVKGQLAKEYDMTDLGECSYYLGMHVQRCENGDIHIHQGAYIHQMLERFGMTDVHPVKTPMRTDIKLRKHKGPPMPIEFKQEYQSKVGSANWPAIVTRPDISEAVGVCSRFCANPNTSHMDAVNHILAYLKGTPELGIRYRHQAELSDLHAYVDSDWAGCLDTRKSTTGYVIMLAGAPIAWKSKRQDTIAQSTMEAEYIAGFKAAQEVVWIQNLINDLRIPELSVHTTQLLIDNNSALKLSRNPELHDKAKHIDLKYHYLRKMVTQERRIKTERVASEDNLADPLTKPLARDQFEDLRKRMGMVSITCKPASDMPVSGRVENDCQDRED